MLIIIGLMIIPFIVLIIVKSNMVTTNRKKRIILNLLLVLITIIYIIACWIIRAEPFDFHSPYSEEYMFYEGEYILYTGIIIMFTPFIWIVLIHFAKMLFKAIRVRKNAIIKKDEDYLYYRGDLDKIPHSIIMFTSQQEVDLRKSISATILKLKLTGYIKEKEGKLIYTNKDESSLFESEKMVLKLVRQNIFDKNLYKKTIENETFKHKYLVKNRGGIFTRIVKIIIAIFIPIAVFQGSVMLDNYHFENYKVWPEDDGHTYILLNKEDDIKKLYYDEVKDKNDYYHRTLANGKVDYNYSQIRADKLNYSVVRKALAITIFGTLSIVFVPIFVLISLYVIIQQLIHFTKNYTTTIKGKTLLNKAYALKNYLKDYSLIHERTEEELILWEYYLVYAVALDVNVDIEDNIIKKYVKNVQM